MNVILGAGGHVGSAVARDLLARGEPVTVVGRDPAKLEACKARGARTAVVDLHDPHALRALLTPEVRFFVLNPPAPPSTDTDTEERRTARAIVDALEGATVDKVVVESTYGAQAGTKIGDLAVLFELEQALSALTLPTEVVRGAFYMSNWDASLAQARDHGELPSFFPASFELPMVAPADVGRAAARWMTEPTPRGPRVHHVEGPQRYTPADVAAAFSEALGRQVKLQALESAAWPEALSKMGFSVKGAESFAGMTRRTLETPFIDPSLALKGTTTLQAYVHGLVERNGSP